MKSILATLCLLALGSPTFAAKPNVLFLFADDQKEKRGQENILVHG